MLFKPKKVDLTQNGLAKVVGDLEADILQCLWDHDCCTARDVCDCVNTRRDISFNAVNTVLNRMSEKGLLKKKKRDGCFRYAPTKNRDEFVKEVNQEVFLSLLKDNSLFSYASFVSFVENLPPSEQKKLKKFFR